MTVQGNIRLQPYSPQVGAAVVASLAILAWAGVAGVVRLLVG